MFSYIKNKILRGIDKLLKTPEISIFSRVSKEQYLCNNKDIISDSILLLDSIISLLIN